MNHKIQSLAYIRNWYLLLIFLITAFTFTSCITSKLATNIGYIEPNRTEKPHPRSNKFEHCVGIYPRSLENALNQFEMKTKKSRFDDIEIEFSHSYLILQCIHIYYETK
ncbi:hypothetical protein EHQ92_09520 [Leptospira biflexa]|uniref:hypothetical protein n=1 Tax=Leptospira biflexa TaxID=172 RepID=UPI0010911618|nr:hypothetical protein [Leptospira biflexa]TGM48110.1 hypothetical protein EHQ92_09520 [Leptospira biflexa]TGM49425.1 hypothetical protein EHQ88_03560 [Leptospira biflexa]